MTQELVLNTTYYGVFVTIAVMGVISELAYYYLTEGESERPIDAGRAAEGLPTDVTLTPEDLVNNPELIEIFDIDNVDENVNIILESNEHFEALQLQDTIAYFTQLILDVFFYFYIKLEVFVYFLAN